MESGDRARDLESVGDARLAFDRRRLREVWGFRKRTPSPAMDAIGFGVSGRMAEAPTRADGVPDVCVTVLDLAIYHQCVRVVQFDRRALAEQSWFMGWGGNSFEYMTFVGDSIAWERDV